MVAKPDCVGAVHRWIVIDLGGILSPEANDAGGVNHALEES
jgi:hypothetical protein